MKKSLLFFVMAFALSFGAHAQDKFTVAGGGGAKNGSTYSAMLGDLAGFCSTEALPIEEVQSSGGVANLEMLRANKVKAAIVPTDVILAAKADNASSVANIKTLFSLHPEEVHLIARADTKVEGGLSAFGKNIGGDKVTFNQPEDLKGRAVGAVGGTVRTAQILNSFLHIGWTVQDYPSTTAMMDALTTGKVDAVLVVAGAPSAAVAKLDGRFKLLAIRGNSDTAGVYVPTKLQYEKMNGGRSVDTLSTQALLVTRTFRSPEMMANLGALRECFVASLPKIQDKDGTHPKWQDVNPTDHGKWEWYDLPKTSAAAALAAAPAASKKK